MNQVFSVKATARPEAGQNNIETSEAEPTFHARWSEAEPR